MKYFVILLVVVGFISIANAQYTGDVDFYHKSVNTGFDQHSVLMQSESTKFTKAMFDRPAEALIFSISTSSDVIDTATITMNKQTMSQLFSGLEDDPSNMVLLINGEVKPYRIIADNKMVSWMFYVPTESTQVELIPPTSMFEPVKSSEDIPFNVLRTYPPVKQNHVDVSYEDIKCKENLVLLQKYDGSPACVTESTKTKLVERGWTKTSPSNTIDKEPKDDFYYPEYLTLRWNDYEIIQDSDIIVMGDVTDKSDGMLTIKTYAILKGDTVPIKIPVNTIFSKWHLQDGTIVNPETDKTYIFFLRQTDDTYQLTAQKGIATIDYFEAIQDAIAEPTILHGMYGYTVDLDASNIPKTHDDRINYHELVKTASKPVFVDLFKEIGMDVTEDDITLTRGPWILGYTEYSNACGYSVINDETYWLESDIQRGNLTKAVILSENPDPCQSHHESCFCKAQYMATEETISELVYFDANQEEEISKAFQEFMTGHKVANMPDEFVVGNLNLEMKDGETAFCGAFVTDQKHNPTPELTIRDGVFVHRYLSGTIKEGNVISFSLERPMPLCAINEDAKVYPYSYTEEN